MEDVFEINLPLVGKKALVKKAPFFLTTIREKLASVSVDRLPLIEYFVFIDNPKKAEQIKAKVFKTTTDAQWFDAKHSEMADSYSPEFGIPEINTEIKKAIDAYESEHASKAAAFAS
jgi:hypothetical protein